MNWKTMGLFATPLVKIELQGAIQAKQYFDTHINVEDNRQANFEGSLDANRLFHYSHNANVFDDYPDLDWLKQGLEKAGDFAYRELLNYKKSGPLKITNAWFNLCDVGASQAKHCHANCLLSGTFYLNTDSKTHIQFYHPLTSLALHPELYDKAADSKNDYGLYYHHRDVIVKASAGECLFWPSQLLHGYTDNETPSRLSLSFNMMPEYVNNIYQVHSHRDY